MNPQLMSPSSHEGELNLGDGIKTAPFLLFGLVVVVGAVVVALLIIIIMLIRWYGNMTMALDGTFGEAWFKVQIG